MKYLLALFTFLFSPLVLAAIDVTSLASEIRRRNCELAFSNGGDRVLLVVGLNNQGYEGTRHNVGGDLADYTAKDMNSSKHEVPEFWRTMVAQNEADAQEYVEFSGASSPWREGLNIHYRVGGRYAIPRNEKRIIFVHPYFDINESGHFVEAIVKQAALNPEQILVLVDDINLARNQFVLSVGKPDGSGDAHNGLKSINSLIGTGSYMRLRIGVSNPKKENINISRTDWVLGQIPDDDRATLFSDRRIEILQMLFLNLQERIGLDAQNVQKLVGQGSQLIKALNATE